jgi:TPR repeat protein
MITFDEIMQCNVKPIENEINYNREYFNQLKELISNVVPFVGAGMSRFKYLGWKEFLQNIADQQLNNEFKALVNKLLDQNKYLEAAQCIQDRIGRDRLLSMMEVIFKPIESEKEIYPGEAILLFPKLFKESLITTNYDNALDFIYRDENYQSVFSHDARRIAKAFAAKKRILFKAHGDIEHTADMIISKNDYENAYLDKNSVSSGEIEFDNTKNLVKAISRIVNGKILLFLGCGLEKDYTVELIKSIVKKNEGTNIPHFAFVQKFNDEKKLEELQDTLQKINVNAIWFPEGEFDSIRILLQHLIDDKNTEKLKKASLLYLDSECKGEGCFSDLQPVPALYTMLSRKNIYDNSMLEEYTLEEVIRQYNNQVHPHLIIVGEGGIGKSISLLRFWETQVRDGSESSFIPIYIQLNKYREEKKNFILSEIVTKYKSENSMFCEDDIINIIKEKTDSSLRKIVLLLDGWNEINCNTEQLISEIKDLIHKDNIQVIITTRSLLGLMDFSKFQTFHMQLLSEKTVRNFCKKKHLSVENEHLVETLRNPMMLSLYSKTNEMLKLNKELIASEVEIFDNVETRGEILWNYLQAQILKIGSKYSTANKNFIKEKQYLNRIIPYIGYSMEKKGEFLVNKQVICKYILESKLKYKLELAEDPDTIFSYISKMGIVQSEDEEVEFTHQYFRDSAAAFFYYNVAKENIICKKSSFELFGLKMSQQVRELFMQIICDRVNKEEAKDNPVISNLLADIYYYGVKEKGVYADREKSMNYFKKSAGEKDFYASWSLGYCLRQGVSIEKNIPLSIHYTLQALDQKPAYGLAKNTLATYYLELAKDLYKCDDQDSISKKLNEYREIWNYKNDELFQDRSNFTLDEKDKIVNKCIEYARKNFMFAGESGFLEAYNRIGQIYENGQAGQRRDLSEAFNWYLKSADRGEPWAQNRVGWFLRDGRGGLQVDTVKAFEYLRKSAAQDESYAFLNLRKYYKEGLAPCERDEDQAFLLLKRALDLNNIDAAIEMIDYYLYIVNQKNDYDGRKWILHDGKMIMDKIVDNMSDFDQTRDQKKIKQFYDKLGEAQSSIQ